VKLVSIFQPVFNIARQDERGKTDRALSLFIWDTTFIKNELSMVFCCPLDKKLIFLLFFIAGVS